MKKNNILISILAVLILLFFLNITNFGAALRGRILIFLAPAFSKLYATSDSVKNVKNYFTARQKLQLENQLLREQLSLLENKLVMLETQLGDVRAEDASNILVKQKGFKLKTAKVVAKTHDDQSLDFIIDKGKRSGLEVGEIVVGDGAVLAGKIIEVKDDYSIFRFLTDDDSSFTAGILGKSNVAGEIRGKLGLGLSLELIPQELKIDIDDQVITGGLETGVPQGLIIGRVAQVLTNSENPLQKALIRPAISLNNLTHIFVIEQVFK